MVYKSMNESYSLDASMSMTTQPTVTTVRLVHSEIKPQFDLAVPLNQSRIMGGYTINGREVGNIGFGMLGKFI